MHSSRKNKYFHLYIYIQFQIYSISNNFLHNKFNFRVIGEAEKQNTVAPSQSTPMRNSANLNLLLVIHQSGCFKKRFEPFSVPIIYDWIVSKRSLIYTDKNKRNLKLYGRCFFCDSYHCVHNAASIKFLGSSTGGSINNLSQFIAL